MTNQEIIHKIHSAIASAKKSLESAEGWFSMLSEKEGESFSLEKNTALKNDSDADEGFRVCYGEFDGKNMVSEEGDSYPVPANYASKSKLIEGDNLKLTIKPNGALMYKQIELAPRTLKTGTLTLEGNQYKVLTEEATYKVLYASVTFFRANVGDTLTVIVPEDSSREWAAIESVIPE